VYPEYGRFFVCIYNFVFFIKEGLISRIQYTAQVIQQLRLPVFEVNTVK